MKKKTNLSKAVFIQKAHQRMQIEIPTKTINMHPMLIMANIQQLSIPTSETQTKIYSPMLFLATWVIMNLYILCLTCILPVSLKMIIDDGRDTHGQLWRWVRSELWKIARQAGTMTRLTGCMSHRPAGRATSNNTGLTTTFIKIKNGNIEFRN